jgi:hypothetical protein
MRFFRISGIVVGLVIAGIPAMGAPPKSMDKREVTLSEAETGAVKEFETKLADYAALHQQLEANLDKMPENATPEQIDKRRIQLRAQIKTARVGAKQGDFFNPGMLTLVKRVCATKTSGTGDGQEVKSTIMDENPGRLVDVHVNDRYPDGVPVSTMPAQLLEALPKLNDYMEYRFLGKRLVLVDAGAGVVLDITPDVL